MGIYRRQPKMVRFIIAVAGHPTEEARLLSLQTSRRVRKSAEEILGVTPKPPSDFGEFMRQRQQLTIEEALKRPVVKQTAEDRLRIWRQEQATRQAGATAICRDGTYSYSANRRGTCSHHGGVAQWLR